MIQETEAAYLKILESSQTLLTVLKREAVNVSAPCMTHQLTWGPIGVPCTQTFGMLRLLMRAPHGRGNTDSLAQGSLCSAALGETSHMPSLPTISPLLSRLRTL